MGYDGATAMIYTIEYKVNMVSICNSVIILIELLKAMLKAVISL